MDKVLRGIKSQDIFTNPAKVTLNVCNFLSLSLSLCGLSQIT